MAVPRSALGFVVSRSGRASIESMNACTFGKFMSLNLLVSWLQVQPSSSPSNGPGSAGGAPAATKNLTLMITSREAGHPAAPGYWEVLGGRAERWVVSTMV